MSDAKPEPISLEDRVRYLSRSMLSMMGAFSELMRHANEDDKAAARLIMKEAIEELGKATDEGQWL